MIETRRWRPTPAHVRSVLGAIGLALVAVLARRPDLLVLATPLVGASVWAIALRPTKVPDVSQHIAHNVLVEGDVTSCHVRIADDEGRVEDVALRLAVPDWIEAWPANGRIAASLPDDGAPSLKVVLRPTRWGAPRIPPALVVAYGAWAATRCLFEPGHTRTVVALPRPSRFDATAPPLHAPGLVGPNRSPRPGGGAEFAGIRRFQPGDRLRQINWPRSLRTQELHVTSTWADHDRPIMLLVDALNDAGDSGGIDGRASSLDVAVRAAGAIAAHYVDAGDRVSLVVLEDRRILRLPPAHGRRHLRRLLEVLASIEPGGDRFDDGHVPRGLTSGPLVVLLSSLVSPGALERAGTLARRGQNVVVVDCLPPGTAAPLPGDRYSTVAWRLRLLAREREIRRAGEAGVAVVPWRGPGSLDAVLRSLHHGRARRTS